MQKFLSGGGNKCALFLAEKNTAGTAIVVCTSAGSATAAATAADALFNYTEIEETAFDPDSDGGIKVTLTQEEDTPELYAFLESYAQAPETSTGTITEATLEDGQTRAGSNASGKSLILVKYGAVTDETTKRRKLTVIYGSMDASSGGWSEKSGEMSKPTAIFNSAKPDLPITVPKALLDTILVESTSALDITLPKGRQFKVSFQAIPA